jgi:hypothetical protein
MNFNAAFVYIQLPGDEPGGASGNDSVKKLKCANLTPTVGEQLVALPGRQVTLLNLIFVNNLPVLFAT